MCGVAGGSSDDTVPPGTENGTTTPRTVDGTTSLTPQAVDSAVLTILDLAIAIGEGDLFLLPLSVGPPVVVVVGDPSPWTAEAKLPSLLTVGDALSLIVGDDFLGGGGGWQFHTLVYLTNGVCDDLMAGDDDDDDHFSADPPPPLRMIGQTRRNQHHQIMMMM